MRYVRRHAGILLGMLLSVAGTCSAQQMMQGMQPPDRSEDQQSFFYEAVNLIADDPTQSRIDISYRIDNQFLIAVRNNDPSIPFRFVRRGDVVIELIDTDGVSKARDINRFEIGEDSSEPNPEHKSWKTGIASFTVPPGEYTVVFEVDDLESSRKFLDRNRKVTAKRFDTQALELSGITFVNPSANDTLTLVNFGGNTCFGKGAFVFFQVHSKSISAEAVELEYSINTQQFFQQEPKVIAGDTIRHLSFLPKSSPKPFDDSTGPAYQLVPKGDSAHTASVILPLKAERFPLRPFVLSLKVKQGTAEASLQKQFRMVWPEMPMSLRDVDFALEALRHITRESELDSLKSGSRDARLQHLEGFWKKKDPAPETEYNPVEVEYYRRVDYSLRNFSSMRGGDGYKSDRGRIYILYGPPTKTERTLDPSAGYQEVWIYERLNKKFVFIDQSKSGNYTLVSTQAL